MTKRLAFLNNWTSVFLGTIERVGNALPHPATIFAILGGVVIIASGLAAAAGLEAIHPGTGDTIRPVSLLTLDGLHRILTEMVTNFTGFAPLGTVLVAMLGIGVMEASGLIAAALRLLVLSAPARLLTFVIVLAGVLSNTASEIGYVLLVPLGGVIFLGAGRHPIAGLAAAFAGVSGGYSANLLLGTVDPLLAGLSEEAAQIIDGGYRVNPAANYFFMVASTFVIAAAGTWVTERIVVPRLGTYTGEESRTELSRLDEAEWRGLRFAMVALAAFGALLLWGTVPADGFLRNPETGSLLRSPFLSGIVAFIFLGGTAVGVAYGVGARQFRNDTDVMNGMGKNDQHTWHLSRPCVFRRSIRRVFRLVEPRSHIRSQRRRRVAGLRAWRDPAHACVRDALLGHQPVHGQRFGKVGGYGAGIRTDVHATRLHPGADAGRIPYR